MIFMISLWSPTFLWLLVCINVFGISKIKTSLYLWALMTAVNITDTNAAVGLGTYSLFIQYLWMLPFSQVCPLIIPSRLFVRNMIDSITRLYYWLVRLFTSNVMNHIMSCSWLSSDNAEFNTLSPDFLINFDKLYVYTNIWPNNVASFVLY